MALTYVLGRVGQGKSHHIFESIRQQLERDAERAVLLLVPEQFTLQAERDLIRHLGSAGLLGAEVLSLSSLGERVLKETGGWRRPTLDEAGKCMVLRRVVAQEAGRLRIYGPVCRQSGFIRQLSEFISQLKQYQVEPEQLRLAGEQLPADSLLAARLHDLLLLNEAFGQQIQGRYLDLEDRRTLFLQRIPQSQWLKDALIYVDGYNTMSEQNRLLLEQLILCAEHTTISLGLPPLPARDGRIFKRVEQTRARLHEFALKHGIEEKTVYCRRGDAAPPRSPEISHLEQELYAGGARAFPAPPQDIRLLPAQNKLSEFTAAAEEIIRLLRDEGYRLRDIAVILNDIGQYGPVVRRVMAEHDIPVFMDQKRDIMQHPTVRMLLALLDIIIYDYPQPAVFAYMKSGLADLTAAEAARLENYALAYGLRGRQWTRPFTRGPIEEAEAVEPLRRRLLEPVLQLQEQLQAANKVKDYSRLLFDFMERQGLAERLAALTAAMEQQRYFDHAAENRQLWNIILDCLDQLVELMGDMEMEPGEYREVLEAGFASYEPGIIPTMIDQVLIGSISRSMSHNVRAMFVLGLGDGVIPPAHSGAGLFSRADEEALSARDIVLGPDSESRDAEEKFLIASALGKASERLYLSYALSDLDGSALRPSLLVDRLRQIFPALVAADDPADDPAAWPHLNGAQSSYPGLIRNLQGLKANADASLPPAWRELYRWYRQREEWASRLDFTEQALFYRYREQRLEADALAALSADARTFSISALERFARCPFSYYVHYTLRARERKLYDLQPQQAGEIFHQFMQGYSEAVTRQGPGWEDIDPATGEALAQAVIAPILQDYGEGILGSSQRLNAAGRRIERICRRAARTMTAQIRQGEFRPRGLEVFFGDGGELRALQVTLADGTTACLEGRIDRVDSLEQDDMLYVRIIDYKSSPPKVSLSSWYHGLSLQLLVYLWAALNGIAAGYDGEVLPAGTLYFVMDDPLIESLGDNAERIEERKFREMGMKGMVVEDAALLAQMDRELTPGGSSAILPVSLKANGQFYASAAVLSMEEMQEALLRVQSLVQGMIERILAGEAAIAPVRHEGRNACEWCEHRAVCHFDARLPGFDWQRLPTISKNEFKAKICGEGEL